MNKDWELNPPTQERNYELGRPDLGCYPLQSSVEPLPVCQVLLRDNPIRVVFSNKEFFHISGWSIESLNSQISEKGLFFIKSNGLDSFRTLIMDALLNQNDSPRTQGELVWSDGNDIQISFTVRPLKFKDGYAAMVAIWMHAPDEIGKSTRSTNDSDDFLKKVIEALPHPFLVIDALDYTVVMGNKASGVHDHECVRKCYELTHRKSSPCSGISHPCPYIEVKSNKTPITVEHIHYDAEGNPRYIEVPAYPLFDSTGEVAKIIEYNMDITEQRWAEIRLQTESKRARLYLDILAHDMANQLQIIAGTMELVREVFPLDVLENVERHFTQVEDAVHKSRNLIKKARGTEQLAWVPLVQRNLFRALFECVESIAEEHEGYVLELGFEFSETIIIADRFLELLLTNIIENAIIHNDNSRKHVWIEVQKASDSYIVSISDNGPGIDDEAKNALFNPETRLGGLGLHFSKDVVEKYGGRLEVRDRVEGDSSKGAKFVVWLPKAGRGENVTDFK